MRPVGWPIASIQGCSIAATMRWVISAVGMPKEVCTERDHPVELGEQLVVVVRRAVGEDVRLGADEDLDALDALVGRGDALDLALAARRA